MMTGKAIFYPARFAKFPPVMVNGEAYNANDFTVAIDHPDIEIGDVVRVSYTSAGGRTRSIRCRVTDVPWMPEIEIGLSWRAYRHLEHPSVKPIEVTVEKLA